MRKPKTSEDAVYFLRLREEYEGRYDELALKIGVSERTLRRWARESERMLEDNNLVSGKKRVSISTDNKLHGQRFVFTSAQNNTYVHKEFLRSLETFCEHKDAKLCISKFTYNKNGFQNSTHEDEGLWYDPLIQDYFYDDRAQVSHDLVWCGELDILPTAVNPVSGLESYTKERSCIIPHVKISLHSVPNNKAESTKMIYTTGAVTVRNYIQRKAGQKAEFHHAYGALYVEIDDQGNFFARQLNADDSGCFYDLDAYYTPEDYSTGHNLEAVNYGDIHIEKMTSEIVDCTWYGEDSILNKLKPRYQFIHDLSDFEARNHHNRKDPHFLAVMHFRGTENVEDNLMQSTAFLESIERDFSQIVVVESNHDLAYKKWLSEACTKSDPENARFYHESNAEIYKAIEAGNYNFKIFEWAVKRKSTKLDNVIFLDQDDSFIICEQYGGIECGMHGHLGLNGARGSPQSFRRIGKRCNTGHTHTASIMDGVYTAGVSAAMDMDYNKGLSSWSFSHIFTYPNGKRAIITCKAGKWRA